MTHQQGPCDLFHDPDDDVTTVPHLTATQAEVVELLGLNPERRQRPRLTVAQMATVDDVVRWAQTRQDGSGTAGVHEYRDEAAGAAEGTTGRSRGTVKRTA